MCYDRNKGGRIELVDIAKCNGYDCNKKGNCFRYLATPSEWQAYADFKQEDNGYCIGYWEVNSASHLEQLQDEWED